MSHSPSNIPVTLAAAKPPAAPTTAPGKETKAPAKAPAASQKAAAPAAAAAAAGTAKPVEPSTFYRRYHNWNTPVTVQSLGSAPTLEKCEATCTSDPSCAGVSYDASVQSCVQVPKGNFDPHKGLRGRFTSANVVASMKDRSLKAAPLDCFGPFKLMEPGRVKPEQCPLSREAAVNEYFEDAKPLALFGNMLSSYPTKERYE